MPSSPPRLGRYTVVRRLGAGGMAEVFLARSRGAEGVDKSLVVKRILPDYAENPHFRAMFIDEARVALRLNHPNVVQVYGFETDGPTLLLIMEHVDGPDLGLLAGTLHRANERVPPPLAAFIVREVARGLHYAHERVDEQGRSLEIVHRDVSPSNVLLSYEGAAKIGDFGIAHARSATFREEGIVQGKYGYMAPEQARGEPVDRRADVYALGVLLAELLLGRSYFHGSPGGEALLERVRRGEVPEPGPLLADAPESLRRVVESSLRVDREHRYASAREMSLALTQCIHGFEAPADALALEQFLGKVLPPRKPSVPPPRTSSGPPPPLRPEEDPERTAAPPREPGAVTLPELMLMPEVPAPRVPRIETTAAMRERAHVAVIVGRLTIPASAPECRPLLSLIDSLAFKAEALLEWRLDDSFTLVVGALRPHVDDALRAARLCLDIVDAARSLAVDAEQADRAPAVALGLARGVAGCARDAEGSLLGYELVDDVLPLAASLAAQAQSGEALVSGRVARIVRRVFVLRDAPPRGPTGIRTTVLERIKTRAERDRTAEAQGWSLLGRAAALDALRDALTQVVSTRASMARLVTGELGIGKTAALGAFLEGIDAADPATGRARHVRAEGIFGGASVAYGLTAQLVRQVLALEHEDLHPDARERPDLDDRDALGRALDAAIQRWNAGTASRAAAGRALRVCVGIEADTENNESATTRELALVLRPMLTEVARHRPLVVVLDALELADSPSRALMADLARRPPGAGVLLVMALRDDDPIRMELGAVTSVALSGLDLDARRRLIAASVGADVTGDALLREVSSVAGGNPQTILDVVEALNDRDRIRVREAEGAAREVTVDLVPSEEGDALLPGTLQEVLAARIESLSPEARGVLRWCALCEGELTADLVDLLGGVEGPRIRARLVRDGILVTTAAPTAAAPTPIGFAHPALAGVVRGSIDPTVLPAMHARIAEVLERREVAPGARGPASASLARHREAAGAMRPAARAWLDAAAAFAAQGGTGLDEARDAYERVLQLTRQSRDSEGWALQASAHEGREDIARALARQSERRAEVLALRDVAVESRDQRIVARALARQSRYKIETAPELDIERDVVAAVRAARRANDPRTEAEARWVLALHRGHRGRVPEALEQAQAALAALGEQRSPTSLAPAAEELARSVRVLRVEILLAQARLHRWMGELRQSTQAAAQAHAVVSQHGLKRQLGAVYDELGMGCLGQGAPAEALRFLRAAVALDRAAGSRERIGVSLAHAGEAYAALGQGDTAMSFLRRATKALELQGRQGVGSALARAWSTMSNLSLARNDLEAAVESLDRARSAARATGERLALVQVALGDARVHLIRKQYRHARLAAEGAERAARESRMADPTLHARALVAEACALMADRKAARQWLELVFGDAAFADPARRHRGDQVLLTCASALRALGDGSHADLLASQAISLQRALATTARAEARRATPASAMETAEP